jgi:hypothetical protein
MARLDKAEAAAHTERFRRYLREHHQPITRPRDLVAQVVFLAEDHLSVEAISRELRQKGEQVGTATVYRTLELLVESGLDWCGRTTSVRVSSATRPWLRSPIMSI